MYVNLFYEFYLYDKSTNDNLHITHQIKIVTRVLMYNGKKRVYRSLLLKQSTLNKSADYLNKSIP